jgi:CHAT domain
MNLTRISVDVTADVDGWAVSVTDVDAAMTFGQYRMDAVKVDLYGRPLRVPVVPLDRRPKPDAEHAAHAAHAALCAGDEPAITALLKRLASDSTEPDDVRMYGHWLFECLLAPVWASLRTSGASGLELALRWPASEIDLHSLVWEAMHDGSLPLAGLPNLLVVVTRIVEGPAGAKPPAPLTRSPRVLFVTGSKATDPVIRPGLMFMGLLRKFDAEGISITRAKYNVTLVDLATECRRFQPDVVHLVAHGKVLQDGSTVLKLGDKDDGDVTADQLTQAFTADKTPPVAVVLSACHSGGGVTLADSATSEPVAGRAAPLAAQLVAGGIPIVTAMAGAVSEPACRMYTTSLIEAIHQGKPFTVAAAEGRAAALIGAQAPSQHLDWAMPATFLAANIGPDYRPLDPTALRQLVDVAHGLRLRWNPLFVGRQDILESIDKIFSADPKDRTELIAIMCKAKTYKLGSTRLLREIAFRLLRAGHVPLLLAENPPAGIGQVPPGPKVNLRGLLAEILEQVVLMALQFGLRPPPLSTLKADSSLAGLDAVTGVGLDALDPSEANQRALEAVSLFRYGTAPLNDPSIVRIRLANDLTGLAAIVSGRETPTPFGPHTRVVVLADRVHEWTGGLGPLLELISSHGLGLPGKPAPVIVTASETLNVGPTLDDYVQSRRGYPAVKPWKLGELTDEEAALGFQWVLLNPWDMKEESYRYVYVAEAGAEHQKAVQEEFDSRLKRLPANARDELYVAAERLKMQGHFIGHDDFRDLEEYERQRHS